MIGIAVFGVHLYTFPDGVDHHFSFQPTVTAWLNGQPVFTAPYYGAFNAPWLIFLLLPLEWLGNLGAMSGLTLLTVFGVFAGWRLFDRANQNTGWAQFWGALCCLLNLHLFDLISRGQIDVFVLFGLALMFIAVRHRQPDLLGLGWVFSMVRPTSISLVILYTVVLAWQGRYFWRALRIPIATFVLSLIIFGPTWPIRWYTMIHFAAPPKPGPWLITWFHVTDYFGVSSVYALVIMAVILAISIWVVYRYRPSLPLACALLAAGSVLVFPYALSYNYPVVMVAFIPVLLKWKTWLVAPLYLLTLTPLLRIVFGLDFAWIDIALPLFAWLLLCVRISQLNPQPQTRIHSSTNAA